MTKTELKTENCSNVERFNRDKSVSNVCSRNGEGLTVKLERDLDPAPSYFYPKMPWCSIYYHELNQRYGDPFHGHSPIVKVDGWTHPCDGTRFCLGIITNICRTREIELVRRSIGNGVSLIYEQGNVSLRNSSETSIFVQSEQLNTQWKLKPKRVIKIPSGYEADVFNNDKFVEQLSNCHEFEAVYKLNNQCTLRLSFIKGWGDNYRNMSFISSFAFTFSGGSDQKIYFP